MPGAVFCSPARRASRLHSSVCRPREQLVPVCAEEEIRMTRQRSFGYLHAIIAALFLLGGCTPEQAADREPGPGAEELSVIVYTPAGEVVELPESVIRSMPEISGEAEAINAAGYSVSVPYTGHELEGVLEAVGVARSDLGGIRIVSRDGYGIELPRAVILEREIILATRVYGDDELKPEDRPFRLVVPGERTMYWGRGLAELHLHAVEAPPMISTMVLLTDGVTATGGRLDLVALLGDASATITMLASDGMERREVLDPARRYYIDLDDDDRAPFFNSPDHARGMNLRNVMAVLHQNRAYLFLAGFASSEGVIQGSDVVDLLGGLLADRLVLVSGGDEVKIDASDLASGAFEVEGQGAVFRSR